MNNKITFSIVGALVIGLLAGYFIGGAITSSREKAVPVGLPGLPAPTFSTTTPQFGSPSPSDVVSMSLSGTVTAIQGNSFIINSNLVAVPGENALPVSRQVNVTDATDISVVKALSASELQAALAAQQKELSAAAKAGKPISPSEMALPSPVTTASGTFSAITVGELVDVTANSNIRTATSFTATAIQVEEQ